MAKGNPNDESMKLNFIPKVWDDEAKEFKPFYIAPDSTDKVRGDVYLSDDFSESDAATGVTAATPKLLSTLRDAYIDSATESAEAAKTAAEAAQAAAESAKNIADNSIQKNDPSDQKIQGSIIPTAPGTQSLGTEEFPWGDIYGTLKGNADSATEAEHAKSADKATTAEKATTADTATKLGAATIGGVAQGIYLNLGVPTAKNANIGSAYLPSYLKGGIDTVCTSPSLLVNLGVGTAANIFAQDPRPGVTGVLPIANGGTGKTDAAGARTALGLGSLATYNLPTGIPETINNLFINGAGQWVEVKGGGIGGDILAGEKLSTNSANSLATDNSASSGKAITIPSKDNKELIRKTFEVPFGSYSIIVRAKVTANTSTSTIFQIIAYAGTTLLKSVDIKPNYFLAANTWRPIGIGVDFAATAACNLVIVIKSVGLTENITAYIDSLTVMLAPVAINMIG